MFGQMWSRPIGLETANSSVDVPTENIGSFLRATQHPNRLFENCFRDGGPHLSHCSQRWNLEIFVFSSIVVSPTAHVDGKQLCGSFTLDVGTSHSTLANSALAKPCVWRMWCGVWCVCVCPHSTDTTHTHTCTHNYLHEGLAEIELANIELASRIPPCGHAFTIPFANAPQQF